MAAGADLVVATERSRMAMPETRIGFFPDVGASGWLHDRCPPGYPEYLALTGYEALGGECLRLGLATHLARSARLQDLLEDLVKIGARLAPGSLGREEAASQVRAGLPDYARQDVPPRPELDAWVARHFAGRESLGEIVASLSQCSQELDICGEALRRISERSPTALALTLKLLRANRGRPLPEVLAREARAARLMVQQPDYLEGIRARLIDRDDRPRWQPARLSDLGELAVEL
ncbi:MAG: enoyl-CoA hydratase/isomerase family protein [Desulfobaccales bacterium]